MSKSRDVKSVSFNRETESKLLDHINKFDNFSSYVKNLIINDMNYTNKLEEIQNSINDIKVLLDNKKITDLENNTKENNNTNNIDLEQRNIINNILNANKHK